MTPDTGKPIAPADEGVIGTHDDGRAFIRFERHLPHPVERVWAALTERERIEEWLTHHAEIEPVLGGRIAINLGKDSAEGDDTVQTGTITEFDPPRVLESDNGEDGVLRWELRPDGDGCALTFTFTFRPGERARNSVIAGWQSLLEFLPDALDGNPADWDAREATRTANGFIARNEEIYWHYRNKPR